MNHGQNHTLTGEFRFFQAFQSSILAGTRDIIVYLPPGYHDDTERRYPVLYLQDGQNVFDSATSFQGDEWEVDETAERLIGLRHIEPLMIVGIYNAGFDRMDEYTPTVDAKHGRGGKGFLYGEMLRREIKPMIDRNFRTHRGPENTGLGGSSLGGLITLDVGLRLPNVFGNLAVMSPSLWWDNRLMLARVSALPAALPLRIWIDMGSAEGDACVEDCKQMRDALEQKGWSHGIDLRHWTYPGAAHTETAWAGRVGEVLEFLFPVRSAPLRDQPL